MDLDERRRQLESLLASLRERPLDVATTHIVLAALLQLLLDDCNA